MHWENERLCMRFRWYGHTIVYCMHEVRYESVVFFCLSCKQFEKVYGHVLTRVRLYFVSGNVEGLIICQ